MPVRVYAHAFVEDCIRFLLDATPGELNDIARRLQVADPDRADDIALRILNAGAIKPMTAEQADRIWQAIVGDIADDTEDTDANANPVPDVDARPHRRGGISATAD